MIKNRKKILFVDDEESILDIAREYFGIKQYDVIVARNGFEAIEILEKEEVDCCITDINMPGMSGLELLEHIKKTYFKPPPVVMMITAYGDEENKQMAEKLGADAFLTKPLDFKLLKKELLNI